MTDVRSLLRQERAAREQATKPARPTRASAAPAAAPMGRKRKAVDDEPEGRKRTRADERTGVPSDFFDGAATEQAQTTSPTKEGFKLSTNAPNTSATQAVLEPTVPQLASLPTGPQEPEPAPAADDIDEEEWAAFERDLATPPPEKHIIPALVAAATVQAAPMTAAELAAQAREDMSAQRGRRDAEIEAEKEDAARQLENELDEMEGWEERARKLREKREALRNARDLSTSPVAEVAPPPAQNNSDDESDDDFEEDDWDSWGMGAA